MLGRLLVGMVVGLVVGAAAAAGLSQGLQVVAFTGSLGVLLAYAAAGATGAVTGLVAGKPIWAAGAKTEAGLKAVFGAVVAAGAMFALRQWAQGWVVDLAALHAGGPAPVGELPAASLPLIAAALGAFFGVDNAGDAEPAPARKRVEGAPASRVRAPGQARPSQDDDEDAPEASAASRRARR